MTWDLIGHEWAVHLLQEHIRADGVRHAYLFTGPAGVGKGTLALRFTRALVCANPPSFGDFCGECRPCRMTERRQFPDLTITQAETVGGELKVDAVRELQHTLTLMPYEADRRIAILLRFHEANENAQNALLKTLEEAPGKTVLLLTADTAENLLPTIVSRCEQIRLRPLSSNHLLEELKNRLSITSDEAGLLAKISGGRPGLALRLHSDPELRSNRRQWMDELFTLLGENLPQRFEYVDRLVKVKRSNKEERDQFRMRLRDGLIFWQSLWRDVMLQTTGLSGEIANIDYRQQVTELARTVNTEEAGVLIRQLDSTSARLGNANLQLLLEALVMGLPRSAASEQQTDG